MFSQSLFAQLLRMLILLIITLYAVHHWQPLQHVVAANAAGSGCHQQTSVDHSMEHH